MQYLAQLFPTGTVDKLLSLDPLSLALLIVVIVVAVDFIKNWFKGKSTAANDAQQMAVIKFLTDEKSPMVVSSNRVAAAVEQGNKRSEELTAALLALGDKTDVQTTSLNTLGADFRGYTSTSAEAIEEFRADVDTQHAATEANINSIKTDIATHMAAINEQLNSIRDTLQKRNDCADVVGKVDDIKKAVERLEQAEAARAVADKKMITDTLPAVPPSEAAA